MTYQSELNAKAEHVPVFINDELVMMNRWTLTVLKAQAYDEGIGVEKVLERVIASTLSDPERLAAVMQRAAAGAH